MCTRLHALSCGYCAACRHLIHLSCSTILIAWNGQYNTTMPLHRLGHKSLDAAGCAKQAIQGTTQSLCVANGAEALPMDAQLYADYTACTGSAPVATSGAVAAGGDDSDCINTLTQFYRAVGCSKDDQPRDDCLAFLGIFTEIVRSQACKAAAADGRPCAEEVPSDCGSRELPLATNASAAAGVFCVPHVVF